MYPGVNGTTNGISVISFDAGFAVDSILNIRSDEPLFGESVVGFDNNRILTVFENVTTELLLRDGSLPVGGGGEDDDDHNEGGGGSPSLIPPIGTPAFNLPMPTPAPTPTAGLPPAKTFTVSGATPVIPGKATGASETHTLVLLEGTKGRKAPLLTAAGLRTSASIDLGIGAGASSDLLVVMTVFLDTSLNSAQQQPGLRITSPGGTTSYGSGISTYTPTQSDTVWTIEAVDDRIDGMINRTYSVNV